MTAKDILRKTNEKNKVFGMIGGNSPLEKSMVEAMKEYAKLKCEEQRKLCQQHFLDTKGYEDIKSAPEPKFD